MPAFVWKDRLISAIQQEIRDREDIPQCKDEIAGMQRVIYMLETGMHDFTGESD